MLEEDNSSDESTIAAVNSTSTADREGMFIDSTKKNYDSHLKKFCDFFHVSFNKSEGISRNLLVNDCFCKYFGFLRLSNVSVSLLLFVPSLTHSIHFNLCSLRHTILRKQLLIQSFSFII